MIGFFKPGSRVFSISLALGSVLFVIAWRFAVIASRPSHVMEIATEVGSIPQYKEELNAQELVPGSDGHALIFFKETEIGLGTYFWDSDSNQCKMLFQQREKWYAGDLDIVAWSPNDRYVACAYKCDTDPQNPTRNIDIYDGNSGEAVQKIVALWDSQFVWLSDHSFVYSQYNPYYRNIQAWPVFEQEDDGKWVQTRMVKFGDGKLENLTAISPHAVAWQENGAIWTFDFISGISEKIWDSTTDTLESFTCAENGNLVLHCTDANGPLSLSLRPPQLGEKESAVLGIERNPEPKTLVTISESNGAYTFQIKTADDKSPVQFVWNGMVESYALAGDFLYFVGNTADSSPGIWQYNVRSKEVYCLDSTKNLTDAKQIVPVTGMGANAEGNPMTYHVWAPAHITPGKKYPLIIGQTHYMWFSNEQIAPNAQWYFAFADRPSWWQGLSDWESDVMGLYSILSTNASIDTNRVFIFGTSAESAYIRQLFADHPDLWKGAILFDSVAEPDPQNAHLSSIFIAAGHDDGDAAKTLRAYQDNAARAGVPVTLVLQDGGQHITRSIATERERARQFAAFLLKN